ncbi:MAG: hypothetical protein FJX62_09425 [Alphaproteobacteria bacterium]|nr:hypothetical protein [Alphaproteobacteria bacterium]
MFAMLTAAVLSAAVGGCSSNAQLDGQIAAAAGVSSGPTVTFESIDGPPAEVFDRLVSAMADEAGTRQVAVVSRNARADYRVRGYLTAAVSRGQVSLAWVWDVYDANRRRVQRFGGEEAVGGNHRDGWSAADHAVLRRIARAGMERLDAFLRTPPRPAPSEPARTAVASAAGETPRTATLAARP